MKKSILSLILAAFSVAAAHGQIAFYSFSSDPEEAPSVAANLSASVLGTSGSATTLSGVSYGSDFGSEPYTRVNGSFSSSSASSGGIVEFTLTPDSGYQINISSISFDISATGAGPDSIAISTNGGSSFSTLLTGFQDTDATFVNHSVSATFTSPITVQISGFGGGNGNMDIDSISVNGSVLSASAIPEPSTYAAILGGLALGVIYLRRRRKNAAAA